MCGPWSRVQELNSTTPEKKKALETTRKWHHEHVLMFVKKVFNKQVQAGRCAHVEHPKSAASWNTRAFRQLMATYAVDFDQCEYGLSVDGQGLNKKPTRVLTNKCVMTELHRPCTGKHVPSRLLGGNRTHQTETYPPPPPRAGSVDCRVDGIG